MNFEIKEYLDALRTGELDKFINLPYVALHAYYPEDKVSSVGSDQLLPLLIYCFEKSDLSEADLIHFKVFEKVMQSDVYFVNNMVGFNCNTLYSAFLAALCMKRAGVTFPSIPLKDFEISFPEAQKILDPKRDEVGTITEEGVIDQHMGYFFELLKKEDEVEQADIDKRAQVILEKTQLYQKKEEVCTVLKKYLETCLTQLKKDEVRKLFKPFDAFLKDKQEIASLRAALDSLEEDEAKAKVQAEIEKQLQTILEMTPAYHENVSFLLILSAYVKRCLEQAIEDEKYNRTLDVQTLIKLFYKEDVDDLWTQLLTLYREIIPMTLLTDEILDKIRGWIKELNPEEKSTGSEGSLNVFPDTVYEVYSVSTVVRQIQFMLNSMVKYQEEFTLCSKLKESLETYSEYCLGKKKRDRAFEARFSLAKKLYEEIEPYQFLGSEQSECIQAFTVALKSKIDCIPKAKMKANEKALLSILYEPRFLEHISPCEINIISEFARTAFPKQRFCKPKNWKNEKIVELDKRVSVRDGKEVLRSTFPVQQLHTAFWKQRGRPNDKAPKAAFLPPSKPLFEESDLSMLFGPLPLTRF